MAPEQLKEGYRKVLATIYDRRLKNYFTRCNHMLDSIEDRDLFQRRIRWPEIRILMKSFARQPFTAYGASFIRFAVRNFFKNRNIFAESIKLAIEGHHFHMITHETLKADQLVRALEKGQADFRQQLDGCLRVLKTNSAAAMAHAAALWRHKIQWLNQIQKKVEEVHTDFQADVRQCYADVSRSIHRRFRAFESSLHQETMDSEFLR